LCATRFSGKLNGEMAATAPRGNRRVEASRPVPWGARIEGDHLAKQTPGLLGRDVKRHRGPVDLHERVLDRLAGFAREPRAELVAPRLRA